MDTADAARHLSADEKGMSSIHTPGGPQALKHLNDDEKGVNRIYTHGGPQTMSTINRAGLIRHRLLTDDVSTIRSQARDHGPGEPLLERLGLGLAAGEDEGPEAGLVDDGELLSPLARPTLSIV